MSPQPLVTRVERLEQRMTALETVPARVEALESQIVQLRTEMRSEFSAARGEIKAMGDRLEAAIQEARDHSRAMFERSSSGSPALGKGPSAVRAVGPERGVAAAVG